MIRRRLALTPAMEGERLAAAFGGPGLLFVSSGPDGLSLSDAPRPGELLHAIFLHKRLAVFGAAISPSASIEGGDGLRRVRDGARLSVGNRRLVVRLGRRATPRREGAGRILPAAAVALALAMVLTPLLLRGPDPQASSAPVKQESPAVLPDGQDAALPPLGARAAGLVEEARVHAMEGRPKQARLALVEAMEVQPNDPRIAALLQEVGREPEGDVPEVSHALEGMMEEGLRRRGAGDLPGARKILDEALGLARGLSAPPPIVPTIAEVRREVMEELRARLSDQISALGRLLEVAPGMEASHAMRELASARRSVEEIAQEMPQEAEVIRLRAQVDAALTAAAARGIAAASAAERYSGCGEALPLYRAIAAPLGEVDPMRGREASDGIKRCQIGAEARGR